MFIQSWADEIHWFPVLKKYSKKKYKKKRRGRRVGWGWGSLHKTVAFSFCLWSSQACFQFLQLVVLLSLVLLIRLAMFLFISSSVFFSSCGEVLPTQKRSSTPLRLQTHRGFSLSKCNTSLKSHNMTLYSSQQEI